MIEDITKKVLNAKNICIISHDGPDADAIGSSLALEDALRQLNKNVRYILQTNVNDAFKAVLGDRVKQLPKKNEIFDLVFVLDCSCLDRIQNIDCHDLSDFIIIIDHHFSRDNEGNICWRENVQSTGVLIYQLLLYFEQITEFKFNSFIATNLFLSIRGDTNNFKINNNNFDIYKMASELTKYSPDMKILDEIEQNNISFVKLIGKTLNKLVYNNNSQIAYLIITKEEIDLCGSNFNDASHVIDLLKDIKEIKVIYLIIQNKNRLSIKARSDLVNVGEIMLEFGGGGHSSAAGISNYYCKDIYVFIDSLIRKTMRKINNES